MFSGSLKRFNFFNLLSNKMENNEIYQCNKWIYIPQGQDLPCRCVRCNAVVNEKLQIRTFKYLNLLPKYGTTYPNQKITKKSYSFIGLFLILLVEIYLSTKFNLNLLLMAFFTFIIYIPFIYDKVQLSPSLCTKHNKIRIILKTINYFLLFTGIILMIAELFDIKNIYPLGITGFAMFILSFISDIIFSRYINILSVLYITNDNEIVIDKVCEEFRNNFPEKVSLKNMI